MQEPGQADDQGQWPYQGVYRVRGQLPIGYRVGGTAIVAGALLHAAPDDHRQAAAAIERATEFVLQGLEHPLMRPSTDNTYDVRVWGHAYALEYFCQLRASGRLSDERREAIDPWIARLVAALVEQEISGGGWNYANQRRHASFVTAPVVQALLLAHSQGEKVPGEVFDRARTALERSRTRDGAFLYSGTLREGASGGARARLPGSIARSSLSETTLALLGSGSAEATRGAVDAFFEHWDELEKRRQKSGTHEPPYGVAPYYFYFGHRYCAQAIEMLPADERPALRARLLEVILKTREDDGTWNDRVFARSANYGTAMVVLALMQEKTPIPPSLNSVGMEPGSD